MSDRNPNDAPEAGGTMVAVPRLATTPQPEAGQTVVGAPLPAGRPLSFGHMAMPDAQPAAPVPEAGATMVGIGRVQIPGVPAPVPVPEAGGTMVGIGRVQIPGAPAPMPVPEAGGTMVGIGRVQIPGAPAPVPVPEAGGTMVGIGRVQIPGAPAPVMPEEAGGTMVGLGRVGGPMAFTPPPPRPAGPPPAYEIVSHLGGGELGQVFHARHRETGQDVALRIIRPDIVQVDGACEALRDVAALAQNAVHTHLGRILEFDESASPSLVLEYVPGKLLSSLMVERGAAPAPAVIDLGVRLCSALAAAHGAGLAHGRVHAGNVVLEAKTGRWVLVDMAHGYCVQGLEQAHDLYALGALLYQMATGHDPFETEPIQDPRAWTPKLPAGLSALLMRTLAPDPGLWFGSAIELAQALARAKSLP